MDDILNQNQTTPDLQIVDIPQSSPGPQVFNSAQAMQQATPQQQLTPAEMVENSLMQSRDHWKRKIEELNSLMKDLPKVAELLNVVYATRQDLIDNFYDVNTIIAKQQKLLKLKQNTMFNNLKLGGFNGVRLTDQQIKWQIENDTADDMQMIELLSLQANFYKDTIKTCDNLIFGINQKVEVHKIMNGLKY